MDLSALGERNSIVHDQEVPMLNRLAALALVLTLFVSGCAAVAGNINDPNAAGPLPDNYALVMIAWFQANLKDPYSAQVAWMRPPERRICGRPWSAPGWVVNVGINAKNSYGGYTGAQAYEFCFRDGGLNDVARL